MKYICDKYLVLGVFLIFIAGCQPYHMHRVKNISDVELYDVTVTSKDRSFNHGVLIPQAKSGYSGSSVGLDRKNEVVLSWRVEGNGVKKKRIFLDENPGYREVVFSIDGENVTVTYQKY
jgi:hypothetical protein